MVGPVAISVRDAHPLTVLDIRGAVTGSAEPAFMDAYVTACDRGARDLLVNFTAVEHMDSAGISILIGILTDARKREQRLLFTGLTAHYSKIFDLMGLRQYAPIFDTEEAARRWVMQLR